MASNSVAPHPGVIAAITIFLVLLFVLIVTVIIRGFDLGPNHKSGLRGIFGRSCLSVTDSSASELFDIEQNRPSAPPSTPGDNNTVPQDNQ